MKPKEIFSYLVALCMITQASFLSSDNDPPQDAEHFLKMSIAELMDVDIYIASMSTQKIKNAPGVVTVITADEIINMGARDLRDVLRTVPGFELGMRDIGYTRIGVRGISTPNSEKIKILIDGVPLNEHLEGSGTVVFGELPVDDIQRIEIIRGPGSALYGDSAFLGVINIITKKADDINNVNISLKTGAFTTGEISLLVGKCIEDFNLKAYFNCHTSDGMEVPIENDTLSQDPLNRDNSLAGTDRGHTIEGRKKITSGLNLSFKNLYFKGFYVNLDNKHYLAGTGAVTEGSRPGSHHLSGMLGYKFNAAPNLVVEPRLYSLTYKIDNFWESYPAGYLSAAGMTYPHGQFNRTKIIQKRWGGDIRLTLNLSGDNSIIFGSSYENSKLSDEKNYDNIVTPERTAAHLPQVSNIMLKEPTRNIYSAFIQGQWNVTSNLRLTGGVRYDNYNDAGSTVNPRCAAVWNPFEKIVLKLLYGRAYRAPTFVELYIYYGGGLLTGNTDINAETIHTGELELAYLFSDQLYFRANYFHNTIDNLIDMHYIFDDAGFLKKMEYRNVNAKTVVRGVEAEVKALFAENSYVFANYSYHSGKNKATGATVTGMAKHIFNTGLNLGISQNYNLNITGNLVGPRERNTGDTRERLKGYFLVNATLLAREWLRNTEVFVSIFNIFAADCRFPDSSGNLPNDFPLPNSARSIRAGIKLSF